MEAQDASPDQSRDTIVSCPKTKERDTTYQKTKKQERGNKVLQYISLPFTQGAPVVQNTKYASLFRRLGSPIRTDVPRIQNNQSSLTEKSTEYHTPRVLSRTALTKPAPHPTEKPVAAQCPAAQFQPRGEEGNKKEKPPTQQDQQND